MIESLQNGSLSSGSGTETSKLKIIEAMVIFVIKITLKTFDNDYTDAITLITSVTETSIFTTEESDLLALIGNRKPNV